MKKTWIFLLLALLLLLTGCSREYPVDTRIQISLLSGEGYTVEENGQWVKPGDDAVFTLTMDRGCTLDYVDYSGEYDHVVEDGKILLTLKAVRYPDRIRVFTTSSYCTVTYDPNGGEGASVTKSYSLAIHARPNTENAALFRRPGHTLVSWNTKPDGSGTRIGLGSRFTAEAEQTLYAQWAKWSPVEDFQYTVNRFGKVTINAYLGSDETVVIPDEIEGHPVTTVAAGAFRDGTLRHVVLPLRMEQIAPDAFQDSALETVTMFDNIITVSDASFEGCTDLKTLYINAIEPPYGYSFRKESMYADKVDKLILAQGQKKMVFYAGCSVWYNLDGSDADRVFGSDYVILNMGLNGTVNSAVQMQILGSFMEEGDVLFHTLELTSPYQLLSDVRMGVGDDKLWCGLENNYDLFALVDLETVTGEFDSLAHYLEKKDGTTTYRHSYTDGAGNEYLDAYGGIPYRRTESKDALTDRVSLDPTLITQEGMARLSRYYDRYAEQGVTVYVSYACVNMDAVAAHERENVAAMDALVRDGVEAMDSGKMISRLEDFLFTNGDFYDTNYHLLSKQAEENTAVWLRDLQAQMAADGLWEAAHE